ncbi:DNA-directed RNA polymerase [Candidatus Woesearchaeota archaeon]|nr:DNA-directed RNA polymerase [Candidatus Woesearchaeota archaeon]
MGDFRSGGFKDRDSNSGGGPRRFDGPREMHKATCGDCGKECEVPFKPKEGRPVYCRDCYQKHRPERS